MTGCSEDRGRGLGSACATGVFTHEMLLLQAMSMGSTVGNRIGSGFLFVGGYGVFVVHWLDERGPWLHRW